ncbi:hypothetical protein [Plantactinospora sp. WMMB782]|uniref:hypothetical protein n=1 Tax=Plantactinospora sp. WMMB782 TaxID=3404121 RepID=UPI003B93AE9C
MTEPTGPDRTMTARRAGGEVWWRADVEVRNPATNYRCLAVGADGRQRRVNALGDFGHDVPDNTDFRLVAYADSLVFLRESPTESVLVLARRASGEPVRLAGYAGAEAANLYGGAPALRPDPDGRLTLPGDGPTFQVWRLG